MSATTKAALAAVATSYVVAFGVIVTMDPKTKKTTEIGEGKPFIPADEAEEQDLLKAKRIMTAEAYAAKVGGSSVTGAIDAAKAEAASEKDRADSAEQRATKAEAELAALKAAAAKPAA